MNENRTKTDDDSLCPIYRQTRDGFERVHLHQLRPGDLFFKVQDETMQAAYAEGEPYRDPANLDRWTIKARIYEIKDNRE